MIIYTTNFGNYEPVQDIREQRVTGVEYVLFTDGSHDTSISEMERLGWNVEVFAYDGVVSDELSQPEAVRRVKMVPNEYIDIPAKAAWIDGSVMVCPDLVYLLQGISGFAVIKPPNVKSWYDEMLRAFIPNKEEGEHLLELARWVKTRVGDIRYLPLVQTRMILRDFRLGRHAMLGQHFWDIYSMFSIRRDQNIFSQAVYDCICSRENITFVDKFERPDIWEPEGHVEKRRVKNIYKKPWEAPRRTEEEVRKFIHELALIDGCTVREFMKYYTSPGTIESHFRKADILA